MTGKAGSVVVDYIGYGFTPDRMSYWTSESAGLPLRIASDAGDGFAEPAEMVERMDELGIRTAILVVVDRAPEAPGEPAMKHIAIDLAELSSLRRQFPGRFAGLAAINPQTGMAGVQLMRSMLDDPGIVGSYIHTHAWDRPLDHADYYPYYALCSDAGVPVVMQTGASGGLMPSQCGAPISLDRPALYFPGTTFVASHLGIPWGDELITLARKFSNLYIGTGSYPPRHWPESLIRFIRGQGARKVVFGTNFPTVAHRRALSQFDELALSEENKAQVLGENALRIFSRLLPAESPA
jgi:predicted TIM-barrel fold metal-dependent hydrolase